MPGSSPRLSGSFLLYKVHGVDSTRSEAFRDESDMRITPAVPQQNTVFRQVTQRLPWARLQRLVQERQADRNVRKLFTKDLLQVLLFAQLSDAQGLRDIPAMLASQDARRYHSGLPQVARSTLSDAMAARPCAGIFTELLHSLIPNVTDKLARGIGDCIRLIDSTTLQLNSLSAGWARFSANFCGAKAHVVFDPDANCPLYLAVTTANVNDITAAKTMPVDPGATYVFDLGYYDYGWWAKLDAASCRIVTRLRVSTPLRVIQALPVPPEAENVRSDQIGFLPSRLSKSRRNPMGQAAVRQIEVEIKPGTVLRLLSNDLDAPASEIAALYKRRWEVELFFRWIKQGLKLRHFFGTSENAVRMQIAVALIAFVLIRLAHLAQHAIDSLTQFARLIRANILHRKPLDRMRPATPQHDPPTRHILAQGVLF